MRRVGAVGVLMSTFAVLAALAGCNSAPLTGSVSVSIAGLPAGVAPAVKFTKGSYSVVATAAQTLSGLPTGTYSVTPQPATLRGNTFSGTASLSTVTVAVGRTVSDAVSYAAQPGDLWVTRANNHGPDKYVGSSLYSGVPQPGAGITGLNYPYGMAFDAIGDFWVVNFGSNTVLEYSASSLVSGTPAPITSFSAGTNTGAEGIAFDAAGNLWLSNSKSGEVVEYQASTLDSASPTILLTIPIPTSSGLTPTNLAFDDTGDLWVAEPSDGLSPTSSIQVEEYTSASIASGNPSAGTKLSIGSNVSDMGLAFDARGSLWVGFDHSVVDYTAASLAAASPATGITIDTGSTSYTNGVAFDVYGNLWVANTGNNTVVEYMASSLAVGAPVKGITISVTTPVDLAFGPPPYDLPLSR